jgi:hypothetical protein
MLVEQYLTKENMNHTARLAIDIIAYILATDGLYL